MYFIYFKCLFFFNGCRLVNHYYFIMAQFGRFYIPPWRAAVNVAWETLKATLPEKSPCMEIVRRATTGGVAEGEEGTGPPGGERFRFAQWNSHKSQSQSESQFQGEGSEQIGDGREYTNQVQFIFYGNISTTYL